MGNLVVLVVVMIGVGYVLRRLGLLRVEAAQDLNHLVFYVTLPALIFMALHQATLAWSMLAMPAIAWVYVSAGLAAGWAIARAFGLARDETGALMLALAFGNTTYLGYPVVRAFYDVPHLTLAIFYDQLGATMAMNTVGVLVASTLGAGGGVTPAKMLRRLASYPSIWALVLGLALHGLALPPIVGDLLERVGALTAPIVMVAIGLSLQFSAWRERLGIVSLAAVGRLLVLPLLMWGAMHVLRLPLAYQQTAVMQAAMPAMFFSLTLAVTFRLRVNIVVNAIMLTTLLSLATLPMWHYLLR